MRILFLPANINTLPEIIAKYGVLIRQWTGLYYVLLEVSNIVENVRVDNWTAERAIIASTIFTGKPGWFSFRKIPNYFTSGKFVVHFVEADPYRD